jgi:hypothetical protein
MAHIVEFVEIGLFEYGSPMTRRVPFSYIEVLT